MKCSLIVLSWATPEEIDTAPSRRGFDDQSQANNRGLAQPQFRHDPEPPVCKLCPKQWRAKLVAFPRHRPKIAIGTGLCLTRTIRRALVSPGESSTRGGT